MRIALVGQPNSGKSTLFNNVAGYRTFASNFSGTTLEEVSSQVNFNSHHFELVDVPGIYSFTATSESEIQTRDGLLAMKPDVVINVIDASALARSLELTFELLELSVPLVICLNMMDEAERKGLRIDAARLSQTVGVPVVETIASQGRGIAELFEAAISMARSGKRGRLLYLSKDVEEHIGHLESRLEATTVQALGLPARLLAIKLLEQEESIDRAIRQKAPELVALVESLRDELSRTHGRPSDMVISSERHGVCLHLFEQVAQVRRRQRPSKRDRVDRWVLHPFWGYVILLLVLFGFFSLVFGMGQWIERPLLGVFESLQRALQGSLDHDSLLFALIFGLVQGFSGGVGIVLPYLVPFLVGLSVLEDIGYLPRAAFLMDSLMHRIGLHGQAVIPFVLGYGCSVPAIMGVRILGSPRERYITAVLLTFIPCAARTTIIFALVGFYLGAGWAMSIYLLNLVVIGLTGKLLLRLRPEISPGLILEIPSYKVVSSRAVAAKVWFRLREFIVIAWPILIAGSMILSLLEYFHLEGVVNSLLSPLTSSLLGLPREVSTALIFGVLRKELTIIMLVQALGTSDLHLVMTTSQMVVFTLFTLFYIPCLATLAMLRSTIGTRGMLFTLALTTGVATVLAVGARTLFWVIY